MPPSETRSPLVPRETVPDRPSLPHRALLGTQLNWRAYGLLVVLILVWFGFDVLTDGVFLTSRNLVNLFRQASITSIAAAGTVVVIVLGYIDLSIGSAVGLSAIVAAVLDNVYGWNTPLTLLTTLGVGVLMGIWQGTWVAYFSVPAFVVTLGGMLIFRGIGFILTEGRTITPIKPSFEFIGQGFIPPEGSILLIALIYLAFLGSAIAKGVRGRRRSGAVSLLSVTRLPVYASAAAVAGYAAYIVAHTGFPVAVIVLAAVAGMLSFLLRRTKFGRQIYAIGGNREACRLAGINISSRTFLVFALMGLMYGVAGIILAGRLGGAPPNGGLYLELDAIAAAVIGGTSLMGGVGTVGGAVLGALFMETIRNGMSLMNVPTFYQYVVSGVILILAVSLDVAAKGAPGRARFAAVFRLKG